MTTCLLPLAALDHAPVVASFGTDTGSAVRTAARLFAAEGSAPHPSIGTDPEFDSRARRWLADADGIWRYLLVFVLAAIPLLEVLVVVPLGIGLGLDPTLVAAAAFGGNLLPIAGIVLLYDRLVRSNTNLERVESGRRARARRFFRRYGLPGLALAAPIATGVHLAAIIALGLGARGRSVFGWMAVSLALWTVTITVASVTGLSIFQGLV
ncbi:small multi-drug export protein [Natrialbaceae archaeon GCM10025810]|uniref:small multi-drug export protein n=1 Tax=Halovalidus salilacus TaxID=3075124 RepID=UPI00361F912A